MIISLLLVIPDNGSLYRSFPIIRSPKSSPSNLLQSFLIICECVCMYVRERKRGGMNDY